MSGDVFNQYEPDFVLPPGETLLEILEEQNISQAELAKRTGRPKKTINEIIKGKTAITPETALQFEYVLGVSANFWNNLEKNYQENQARIKENMSLAGQTDWLEKFSIKEMIKGKWIKSFDNPVDQLCELMRFFQIASPELWADLWKDTAVAFRKTSAFKSTSEDISAWLRRGEIEANQIPCKPYDKKLFHQILVHKVKPLTRAITGSFPDDLIELCAQAGVAVVFVPQLPKSKISGATRWLSPDKALIQLSLRYKDDGNLWFTFFHEAGHILKHGKRDVFLEDDGCGEEIKEAEADQFARETLIPDVEWKAFLAQKRPGYRSKTAIKDFAARMGVAPGIVVGRLQHDKLIPWQNCNDLKIKFRWG